MTDSPRRPRTFHRLIEPGSYVEPLDLREIFGRNAPLHVDLGCGDGLFLCEMGRRLPEKDFIGVERLLGRVNSAARRAQQIDNVRVLRLETYYAVRYLFPRASVEAFYLLFPDPWPKRRHHRRRVVTNEFLDAIRDALSDGGRFHIATDQQDYLEHMHQLAAGRADFAITHPDPDSSALPTTKFEAKFAKQGLPVYRLELRKISPVL